MNEIPSYRPSDDEAQEKSTQVQAQLRLAQLREEKEQIERAKLQEEANHQKQLQFIEKRNELSRQITESASKIPDEIDSMRAEIDELNSLFNDLKQTYKKLSNIKAEEWPSERIDSLIEQYQPLLNECSEEFSDVVSRSSRMKHTKILSGVRRRSKIYISGKEFFTQFQQGLAFHLPLLLVALIVLFFIWFITPTV